MRREKVYTLVNGYEESGWVEVESWHCFSRLKKKDQELFVYRSDYPEDILQRILFREGEGQATVLGGSPKALERLGYV